MANYSYKAINSEGKVFKGSMNAANTDDLEFKLQEIDLDLISCKDSAKKGFNLEISLTSNKVTIKDLILLCTHFELLDRAGVPITKAIEDLRDAKDSSSLRDVMQDIYESVKAGKLLSEAMAESPKIFDNVFVGLVAAGERTGKLHQSFAYLAEHLKWSSDIKRKTQKAVRYPIFLVLIISLVMFVMMTVVIPKLSDFLLKQNFELPGYTKALIGLSDFISNSWQFIIIVPIILYIFHKIFYKTFDSYSYFIDKIILSIPVIGQVLLKLDVARFSQFFLITFQSGIEVIDCFKTVEKVVHNKYIKKKIVNISNDVSDGSSISNALKNSGVFPGLVTRMFEVGEVTGNMSESLTNVKFFYDREVNDSIDSLVGMIQPALTLIMGGLLMWISISVFGPLYSSFGNLG